MSRLSGVRVLVTGGTSGLGRAMAAALVAAGAHVVLTGRNGDRASDVAAELGPGAAALALDVREPDSVVAAVERACAVLGGLDVLVNNAGLGMRTVNPRFMTDPRPFWDVSLDGFRAVLDSKVVGTFLVSREVIPRMLRDGSGRIVTISMNEQTMTRGGFVPYGPAGAAVEAMARVMAADLAGTAVTANLLLPGGATATGMVPDDVTDEIRAQLLDPAIMGPPIVWLASPAAAGVHDQRIVAREFEHWLREAGHAGSQDAG
jgi:NAD(P)-dependent dehydrogenase (short-subunit alcohol dehydrogenase family)